MSDTKTFGTQSIIWAAESYGADSQELLGQHRHA